MADGASGRIDFPSRRRVAKPPAAQGVQNKPRSRRVSAAKRRGGILCRFTSRRIPDGLTTHLPGTCGGVNTSVFADRVALPYARPLQNRHKKHVAYSHKERTSMPRTLSMGSSVLAPDNDSCRLLRAPRSAAASRPLAFRVGRMSNMRKREPPLPMGRCPQPMPADASSKR